MDIWKHYLHAQSFNLWQSLLKLDSVFINLNFPKPRGAFADSGKHNSQKVLENMNSDTLVKG